MFYDVNEPDISLSDWQKFREQLPRHQIQALIDRDEACLPEWFMSLAWGVAVASDPLLNEAGHRYGRRRPCDWIELKRGLFLCPARVVGCSLHVRECERTNLWTISRRETPREDEGDVLVFEFGGTPIVTRGFQAAMRLAIHCHVKMPSGFGWSETAGPGAVWSSGIGIERCRELVKARSNLAVA